MIMNEMWVVGGIVVIGINFFLSYVTNDSFACRKMNHLGKIKYNSIYDSEIEDLNRNIRQICSKYIDKRDGWISTIYVLRDIVYMILFYNIMLQYQNTLSNSLFYLLYSMGMGTIATGLWVIGHECGHGAYSKSKTLNDTVGFIIHSFLLVPYFSWQYSHSKHHKYTNHLILGETHVPSTKKGFNSIIKIKQTIGDDGFAILNIFLHLMIGWPEYLFHNTAGGKTQQDLISRIDRTKGMSHFLSSSQVMKNSLGWKVEASTAGCLFTLAGILYHGKQGLYWYGGPYLIVNAWLVLYTWLQHTHPNVPHLGAGKFKFLKGALLTIDRPYPALIDHLHHHIGTTHICHHLQYTVPHYSAVECTYELQNLLIPKSIYLYDSTDIIEALWNTSKHCHYVDDIEGMQFYHN